MLGAVFAGGLKAAKRRRTDDGSGRRRMRNRPRGPEKRKPAFLRGKKKQPLGGRRTRKNPKEVSIGRVREQEKKKRTQSPRPGFVPMRQVDFRDPDTGRRYGGKVVGGVPQFSKPDFVSKKNFSRAIASLTSRRPRKPHGIKKVTPTRVQEPSKRVKEPSKTERVSKVQASKERPSKVPSVRKRRKSKGPSYTTSSLNV
tara:strand:+ start:129 stop:725 length:597 start_codon:yes stop_codon:yes gene_type:complete